MIGIAAVHSASVCRSDCCPPDGFIKPRMTARDSKTERPKIESSIAVTIDVACSCNAISSSSV